MIRFLVCLTCCWLVGCQSFTLQAPQLQPKPRLRLSPEVQKRLRWVYPSLVQQSGVEPADSRLGRITSAPVLGRNTLYVTTLDGKLHAFNFSGKKLWSYRDESNPNDIVVAPPVVLFDDSILFGTKNFLLYQVSRLGKVLWKELVGGSVLTSPLTTETRLFVPISAKGWLAALSPKGKRLWHYDIGGGQEKQPMPTPALGLKGVLYLATYTGYLHAISLKDRKGIWKQKLCDRISAPPTLTTSGRVVLSCWHRQKAEQPWKGQVVMYDPQKRVILWKLQTQGPNLARPVLSDDEATVYVGSDDTYLYAIRTQSGKLRWKFKSGEYERTKKGKKKGSFASQPVPGTSVYFSSSPCLDRKGRIYINGVNSHLYALSPQGKLLWQADLGDVLWSSPTYRIDPKTKRGVLFVSAGRRLFAFNL